MPCEISWINKPLKHSPSFGDLPQALLANLHHSLHTEKAFLCFHVHLFGVLGSRYTVFAPEVLQDASVICRHDH